MLESFDLSEINLVVFFDESVPLNDYRNWLGDRIFSPQKGTDLGERMANAFASAFKQGYEKAVLTGSDLPGLNPQIIREGFEHLENSPACIGPAKDGGYYSIGFRKKNFTAEIFENIEWSTSAVYNQTMERFSENKINAAVLPCFSDVDNLEELESLLQNQEATELCHRTVAVAESTLMQRQK